MSAPAVERTLEELQHQHNSEADAIGWQASFTGGSLPGDLSVAILPRSPEALQEDQAPRYYLYRRNPISGKFTLIKKS